jgi:hypothetical protein
MNRRKLFISKIKAYRKDVALFFREVLRFEPDGWQYAAGADIAVSPKVTIRSGQGVGKTAFEAGVALWFLSCFPYARVVAIAPTKHQLNDILWSEISKWRDKSPLLLEILRWTKTYVYVVGFEKRWFAVARAAARPENIQGFHEDNMLFIVDEASGVDDSIMEAILGTLSGANNKLLMCGNPTRTSGVFYESHTKDRGKYAVHRVNSEESGRTNKDNIQSLKDKYGAESNVVRVRVHGEFPLQEDDVFISLSMVEASINNDIEPQNHVIELGVDVARYGDDETVIAPKVGFEILPLIVKRGQSLMRTVGDILTVCRELREKHPDYTGSIRVKIDDTGLGGGVTDRLNEIKEEQQLTWLIVIPVNFAGKKFPDAKYYENLSTYIWAVCRDLMRDKIIKLPNDAELVAQFSIRKYKITSSARTVLESKDEMKRRGISSPDRADAVALACLPVKVRKEGR